MQQFPQVIEAIREAIQIVKEKKATQRIIRIHGEGYAIVSYDFLLDRKYYHGEGGKKMFFSYVCTIEPIYTTFN